MADSAKDMQNLIINQDWPENELEFVDKCPYCASKERKLAYKDVQDWSFYCAPGKWTFWECATCEALYLSPRPSEASIGKAYSSYYTHQSKSNSLLQKLKMRLKNEYFSHLLNINLKPRIKLLKVLGFLLVPFRHVIHMPYELDILAKVPKGKLLDIGCGSGDMLIIAEQIGWDVTGIEIDPKAVEAAREKGLNVIEGSYHNLEQFAQSFDCVICSHVLEHVHRPLEMIQLLAKVLKPQGVLLLSLPNAKSHLRTQFSENWRGLEAPRHLAIPTLQQIVNLLQEHKFIQVQQVNAYGVTFLESYRISQRLNSLSMKDSICLKFRKIWSKNTVEVNSDFIQIIARKVDVPNN